MSEMSTAERLAYMANQIARNFGTLPDDKAAEETAQHIVDFWDPRMIEGLLNGEMQRLSPVALRAMEIVAAHRSHRAA